jgi:hypothetical protein
LALSGSLQRYKSLLGADGKGSGELCGMSTQLANKARGTISGSKANGDDLMTMPILARQPLDARTSLRTPGMLCLPVNGEVGGAKAGAGSSLPTWVRCHWPDQIELVLALTVQQVFGSDLVHDQAALSRIARWVSWEQPK